MKSIIIFLFILVSGFCYSQNEYLCDYRIEYFVDVVTDTSELKFYENWNYVLIRKENKSRFYESNKHFNDSMSVQFVFPPDDASDKEQQRALDEFMKSSTEWRKRTFLGYKVEKDFLTGNTRSNSFKILPPTHLDVDQSTLKWYLTGNTDSLYGLNTLEAIIEYGGREWTAWYCPDIPISDGPYVFSGLPGLIIKIEDESGWYNFRISNFALGPVKCYWGDYFLHDLSQSISREEYYKVAYDAQNNPKLSGVIDPSPELLLRVKEGALWKYFMLLEQYIND